MPRQRQREREGRATRQSTAAPQQTTPQQQRTATRPAKAARQRRSNYAWYRRVPWVAVAGIAVAAIAIVLVARNLGVGVNAGRYIPGGGVGSHVPVGQTVAYSSYPPTSGTHAEAPATWGFHTEPVADEVAVHNLEHGGVVVSQNNISADDLAKLRGLLTSYPKDQYGEVKLLIRPYDKVPAGTFTLTAWTWIDEGLTTYDDGRVRAFLDAHLNKCCESQP